MKDWRSNVFCTPKTSFNPPLRWLLFFLLIPFEGGVLSPGAIYEVALHFLKVPLVRCSILSKVIRVIKVELIRSITIVFVMEVSFQKMLAVVLIIAKVV